MIDEKRFLTRASFIFVLWWIPCVMASLGYLTLIGGFVLACFALLNLAGFALSSAVWVVYLAPGVVIHHQQHGLVCLTKVCTEFCLHNLKQTPILVNHVAQSTNKKRVSFVHFLQNQCDAQSFIEIQCFNLKPETVFTQRVSDKKD